MAEPDWTERRLCDDGACIGVIGPDGRCGACGRASIYWGDERRRGWRSEEDADRETSEHVEARTPPIAEGEIAERQLCPDGACTGLIGDDGQCRACGRRATPDQAE